MRFLQALGAALVIAGAAFLYRRPNYRSRHDVVKIGDFKASMDQEQAIPLWIGVVGIGAGVVLLLLGSRRQP
jgi:hypothetical protein